MNRVRLSELPKGRAATIVAVETPEMQVALMSLGVLEGDRCYVSNIAPFGDPIAIHLNGTKVSLRKKDASFVWVKTVNNEQ